MLPDDPRHGQYAGYVAHIKAGEAPCPPCRAEGSRTRKRNTYLTNSGRPASVPSIGTVRRIQALRSIGYSSTQIAAESGIPFRTVDGIARSRRVYRATAEAVAEAFERLCMTKQPTGRAASYNRTVARKRGWAPPLAWDDIDHDEAPNFGTVKPHRGGGIGRDALIEDAEWLADDDLHLDNVLDRLNVTRDAFHQACRRAGRLDLYHRLMRRVPGMPGEQSLAVQAGIRSRKGAA